MGSATFYVSGLLLTRKLAMTKTPYQSQPGGAYRGIVGALRPLMMAATKRDWKGQQYLQRPEGIVVAMNHLSWFDPFVAGHFVNDAGRPARFLGKIEVFKIPVVGKIITNAGMIPVARGTSAAVSSLHAAIEAVNAGECVVIYPEGTLTRDKNLWPMSAKNGVARIALATGAPVIPAAQWGPQDVLPPYSKSFKLFPRKTMHVWAGPEVQLDDLRNKPLTGELLTEATNRIMRAITDLLADIRQEQAPASLLDRTTVTKPKENS